MWLLAVCTLLLLTFGDAASVKRSAKGPVSGPEGGLEFDCSVRPDGYYADYLRDCRQFYRCANGEKFTFFCTDYTRFDEKIKACVLEDSTSCVDPNVPTFSKKGAESTYDCTSRYDGYYADTDDDCSTYHRCSRGLVTTHHCPEGTSFDEGINACVLRETARCGKEKLMTRIRNPDDPSNFNCTGRDDGFYADYYRGCHQYYWCHDDVKETFFCEAGLLFDENVIACMPENLVDCPAPAERDHDRQIKYRNLRNLLHQLRQLLEEKKHR